MNNPKVTVAITTCKVEAPYTERELRLLAVIEYLHGYIRGALNAYRSPEGHQLAPLHSFERARADYEDLRHLLCTAARVVLGGNPVVSYEPWFNGAYYEPLRDHELV